MKTKYTGAHRVIHFLGSMRFAIILLIVLAAACAAGSFLTQGLAYEEYASLYSENAAHLIMLLGLNDVFHSAWFLILTALLCLSLLLCNLLRMPRLVRRGRREFSPEAALRVADAAEQEVTGERAAVDPAGDVHRAEENLGQVAGGHAAADPAGDVHKTNTEGNPGRLAGERAATDPAGDVHRAEENLGRATAMAGTFVSQKRNGSLEVARLLVRNEKTVQQVLQRASFGRTVKGTDAAGHSYLYADRNKAGLWGPWITHLGILVLIAGFGLGQMLKQQYTVYGLPGDSMAVTGTDYIVTIDDFDIDKDEQGTVTQYTSSLTVHNAADGTTRSGQTSVNHPVTLYGLKFYQNSTGWAGHVVVKENEEQIQEETMCIPGTVSLTGHENLHLSLLAFYPEYDPSASANNTATTLAVTNPGWLYQVSAAGQVIGMNVLSNDYISIDVADDQTLTIDIDDPQIFTLISIKKEPFTWLALLGAIIILAGLMLSFYVQPQQIVARQDAEGTWHVYGWSRKGGLLYKQRLEEIAGKM